jgi:hypothetical protein
MVLLSWVVWLCCILSITRDSEGTRVMLHNCHILWETNNLGQQIFSEGSPLEWFGVVSKTTRNMLSPNKSPQRTELVKILSVCHPASNFSQLPGPAESQASAAGNWSLTWGFEVSWHLRQYHTEGLWCFQPWEVAACLRELKIDVISLETSPCQPDELKMLRTHSGC